ncbi:MAG: PAS domain S-box protein [Burkholderiaceae bacterium]
MAASHQSQHVPNSGAAAPLAGAREAQLLERIDVLQARVAQLTQLRQAESQDDPQGEATDAGADSDFGPEPSEYGLLILREGATVFANQSAAEILGESHAEVLAHGFVDRLHTGDQDRVRSLLQQGGMDLHAGQRIEVRLPGRDGALRWLSMGTTEIPWCGEAARLLVLSDRTQNRARGDSARRTAERYRAVIEHVNEGMVVIQDERVVFANARAAELAGIGREEMQQVGFLHRVHPADHALVLDRQRRRLAGEEVPGRYELRLLLPDASVRWIGISATVVPWDGGQAALVFFSDISQRKQLEEALRSTLEERETVLENSLVGIAFLSSDGQVRWSNSAMSRMFGASTGLSPQQDWPERFASADDRQRTWH